MVDRDLRPVPIGVRGELIIGGAGVAHGYRDQPGQTAHRFVPDRNGARTSQANEPAVSAGDVDEDPAADRGDNDAAREY